MMYEMYKGTMLEDNYKAQLEAVEKQYEEKMEYFNKRFEEIQKQMAELLA